jgi:hypothetical protein
MAEIPELGNNEKFQPSATQQPFGAAGRELGAAGNLMSAFGADIANKASINRSELAGINLGRDPQGDLLPAFTTADKAFNEAYRSTANATLTLKGSELLAKGINTLEQQPKLSSGMISSFEKNNLEGIEDIVAQSPSQDKESLRNNLSAQLLVTKSKLDSKLAAEQKQDVVDTFAQYTQQTFLDLFDIASDPVNGGAKVAIKMLGEYKQNVKDQVEAGYLSKTAGDQAINTAEIQFISGRENAKLQEAIDGGTEDEFLNNWFNMNKALEPTQQIEVSKNLLSYMQLRDQAEARKQSMIVSEGRLRLATGTTDQEFIDRANREMTPVHFNEFLSSLAISQQKEKQSAAEIKFVNDNWNNPAALSGADAKTINAAWLQNSVKLAKDTGVDLDTAKVLTAAGATIPIPAMIAEINANATSGIPGAMEAAIKARDTINLSRPGNLRGVNEDALNMIAAFDDAKRGGQNPVMAAETATKSVLAIDKATIDLRGIQWKNIKENTWYAYDKDGKLNSSIFAQTNTKASDYDNPADYALRFQATLEKNFIALGKLETALKRTTEEMTWDETRANGKKQFVEKSLEKYLGITEQQLPFVHKQILEQSKEQAMAFNELYATGSSDFKYEFNDPVRPTLAEYKQATADLAALREKGRKSGGTWSAGFQDKKNKYETIINSFDKPGRPTVTRVYKDGVRETFFLNTYLDKSIKQGDQEVWQVKLEDNTGMVTEFIGVNGNLRRAVFYVPNKYGVVKDHVQFLEESTGEYANALNKARGNFEQKVKERIQKGKPQEMDAPEGPVTRLTDAEGKLIIEEGE